MSEASEREEAARGGVEHELMQCWNWYFHSPSEDYKKSFMHIGCIKTIESFWRHKNNIPTFGSCFAKNAQFFCRNTRIVGMSFFKDDITPEWEHQSNKGGGKIYEIKGFLTHAYLDSVFEGVLLNAVGGTLTESFHGIRVLLKGGKRQFFKIELWMSRDFDGDASTFPEDVQINMTTENMRVVP